MTTENGGLWAAVDDLLAHADLEGVVANKLGPLAARRLRLRGEPVPERLAREQQLARAAFMTAVPLLGRIRELVDGPLLLVKGPEVACLYPDRARSFVDLDLLVEDGRAAHAALRANGFVEVDDPELFLDHHHLRPLQAPGLWLKIEIHLRPMLPEGAEAPLGEIFEAAVPSALAIDGISAPRPEDHALMLAAHAWGHEPLGKLRDLIDVAAVADLADEAELARSAKRWGMERIWRTSAEAEAAVLGSGRTPMALRLFGRHLPAVRERTVLENHLQRWLHSFWERPFRQALLQTGGALRQELLPEPGESWRDKLLRAKSALLHPRRSMTEHTEDWRGELESGGAGEQ
jgi:hypothetical protein